MKLYSLLLSLIVFSMYVTFSQEGTSLSQQGNKSSLNQLMAYDDFIGICACTSIRRGPQGVWQDTFKLKWKWSYIMEGNGVKDEGWYISEGKKNHFSSIRVYDTLNKQWYVTYFTPELRSTPETWIGAMHGQEIVLTKDQETPQGPMQSVLTFSNISSKGFWWEGKIMNAEKKVNYPFWKIWCLKEE